VTHCSGLGDVEWCRAAWAGLENEREWRWVVLQRIYRSVVRVRADVLVRCNQIREGRSRPRCGALFDLADWRLHVAEMGGMVATILL
jgi:hypothetical protein